MNTAHSLRPVLSERQSQEVLKGKLLGALEGHRRFNALEKELEGEGIILHEPGRNVTPYIGPLVTLYHNGFELEVKPKGKDGVTIEFPFGVLYRPLLDLPSLIGSLADLFGWQTKIYTIVQVDSSFENEGKDVLSYIASSSTETKQKREKNIVLDGIVKAEISASRVDFELPLHRRTLYGSEKITMLYRHEMEPRLSFSEPGKDAYSFPFDSYKRFLDFLGVRATVSTNTHFGNPRINATLNKPLETLGDLLVFSGMASKALDAHTYHIRELRLDAPIADLTVLQMPPLLRLCYSNGIVFEYGRYSQTNGNYLKLQLPVAEVSKAAQFFDGLRTILQP